MRDAALKVLMLNNNLVSGTVPQLGLHTSQKLNTLILSNNPISGTMSAPVPKLKDLLLNNMRISGTLKSLISEDNQTQSELAVFGLSRNLLTGSTDALEPATALETLILAGVRMLMMRLSLKFVHAEYVRVHSCGPRASHKAWCGSL